MVRGRVGCVVMVTETTTDGGADDEQTTVSTQPYTDDEAPEAARRIAEWDGVVHVSAGAQHIVFLYSGDTEVQAPDGYFIKEVSTGHHVKLTLYPRGRL